MNRSLTSLKRTNLNLNKKKLSQTQSCRRFQKIIKNRSNHSNACKENLDSKNIQRIESCDNKIQIESMKQFVKSFQKIQKISQNIPIKQKQKDDIIQNKESQLSLQTCRSSFSKCSQRPQSRQLSNGIACKIKKLQGLQKRVQNILEKKLLLIKNKSFIKKRLNKTQQDQLTNQLSSIIQEIKFCKNEDEQIKKNQTIFDISKKIQILQKLLAQNYSQLQTFKKYFYNSRSIRKSLNPVHKTNHLSKSTQILRKMTEIQSIRQNPSIYLQTINQLTYVKPQQKCYGKKNILSSRYYVNRQPLPKSSYDRDFLNYGNLPVYNYKEDNKLVENSIKNSKFKTFYQTQYKQKKANMINPYQLDCTHDKIKRLKVCFIPHKNKTKNSNFKKDIELQRIIAKKQNLRNSPILKTVSKTQFCREYTNKKVIIQNPIKNRQLINFKNNFKHSLNL